MVCRKTIERTKERGSVFRSLGRTLAEGLVVTAMISGCASATARPDSPAMIERPEAAHPQDEVPAVKTYDDSMVVAYPEGTEVRAMALGFNHPLYAPFEREDPAECDMSNPICALFSEVNQITAETWDLVGEYVRAMHLIRTNASIQGAELTFERYDPSRGSYSAIPGCVALPAARERRTRLPPEGDEPAADVRVFEAVCDISLLGQGPHTIRVSYLPAQGDRIRPSHSLLEIE